MLNYYPYGKILREYIQGGEREKFLTTQHERDDETGLDYRGARFYDSDIGRFLSLDPLAFDYPSFSDYSYVAGNPIMFIDPTGMAVESTHVNSKGDVIAEYDDGDDGVYMHSSGASNRFIIDAEREALGNTGGSGKKIGEIGGVIDADVIYKNALTRNIAEADEIISPWTFKNAVKTGAKWDLKSNKGTIFGLANDGKTQFSFEGNLMESQDIGNHHFGAVGLSYGLFSEYGMLKKAGEYQIGSGTSKPEWQPKDELGRPLPPYGDDPRDQKWIKAGFEYFKRTQR